jgi:hypothetical protein
MARRKHPGAPASLDALCSRYSIDNSRRTRHGALLDAEILAEVYIELLGGKQTDLGLSVTDARAVVLQNGVGAGSIGERNPAPARLSDAERAAHAVFVGGLKGEVVWRAPANEDGWQQEHHHLFADLRKGDIPNEGEYGALSTMTAIMGRMATYSGKRLTWEECLASDVSLADIDSLNRFDDPAPVQPDAEGYYPVPQPGSYDPLRQA